jgi:glycosyltransferase involved in cell wall biosynthesis
VATIIDPDNLDLWCNAVAACGSDPRANAPAVTVPTWDTAATVVSAILRRFAAGSEASAAPIVPPVTSGGVALGTAQRARGRALFIDHTVPTPDQDSGSGDILWYMKIFIGLGYEVTFLTAGGTIVADHYTDDLRRLGVVCIAQAPPEAFVRANGAGFDVALLYRVNIATRFVGLLRRVHPSIKLVFNTVDLHFLREERAAALYADRTAARQAEATMRQELDVMARVDATILLSPAEQKTIAALAPQARTWLIPIVREVPGLLAPLEGRRDVLFIGGFAHAPNVDAILHFVSEIWPQAGARCPGLRLLVVGSRPTEAVLALNNPQSGVLVLGHVPDLHSLLAGCRLSVAPLRYGAGIKGKIVTSLTHGLPCVATSVAVEGMGLTDGVDVLVADTAADYSVAIERLCTDDGLWQRISTAGLSFAEHQFSTATVQGNLERLLESLGV